MENVSSVTHFTLSGYDDILYYKVTFFCFTLLFYCVIIMINVSVIVIITMDRNLHEPMYTLLCNLCINGLFGTAGFYPKFLVDLLSHVQVISYALCMIQTFVIYSSVCIDICLLSVMAYDRYVAICRPLEYHSVMTKKSVTHLVTFSWLAPLGLSSTGILAVAGLKLCGSHIQKIYCAAWMVVKLSCAATSWITSTIPTNINAHVMVVFYTVIGIFIFGTYVQLIKSCLKSLENRGKFMRTCVPHLIVLLNVVIATLFDVMYMRYGSNLPQNLQNFLSLQIVLFPPLLNPLIYGLTLTQIRNQLLQPFFRKKKQIVSNLCPRTQERLEEKAKGNSKHEMMIQRDF